MKFARRADGDLKLLATSSEEGKARWAALVKRGFTAEDAESAERDHLTSSASLRVLRGALLDFIADFANWDNSTVPDYLETSRALTQAAHEALGGEPGTRPLVVDPFAGGGSIPLEALRVGADAFASDLNPVAVLLNKVVLEYIPKYGQRLADEVRKWGKWIKKEAEKELAEFYPKDPDGATPIAYLWARTIRCEGAGCGAEVPLVRSLWLAKKKNRSVALKILTAEDAEGRKGKKGKKRVEFAIVEKDGRGRWQWRGLPEAFSSLRSSAPTAVDPDAGTVKRGSATCPYCGYTTPVTSVRTQLKAHKGGAGDARLMCVVSTKVGEQGRFYRLPTNTDLKAIENAKQEFDRRAKSHAGKLSLVPNEPLSQNEMRRISIPIYGMVTWGNVFSDRQGLSLQTLARVGRDASTRTDAGMTNVLAMLFALALGRQSDACSSLARWHTTGEKNTGTFGRQALGMVWDFCEVNPFSGSTGGWEGVIQWIAKVCESQAESNGQGSGQAQRASATTHPLSDDIASAWITDPPYYDAVPYAHLSDFFYVWLRRMLYEVQPELFSFECVPKDEEVVVDRPHSLSNSTHDIAFYERELTKAFAEGRRVVRPDGVGTIVFASKTTASWEAILKAVVDAGWIITGSWPIDTEMEARVAAQGQARLASSVHLVCRPRENPDGSVREDDVGEWRDVLGELPKRIHKWMPRLAEEGVVGADAIFACLGPALEVFSRHSRVEKASGEVATLREYLEHVWAAVSTEALSMIFHDADAAGLEPDARITAMWLWTLGGGKTNKPTAEDAESAEEETDDWDADTPRSSASSAVKTGYVLEFDAARKIAQGLGIHLEKSESIVEVKGDKARLLPVAERTRYLFGTDAGRGATAGGGKRKKKQQRTLFEELDEAQAAEDGWTEIKGPPPGTTVLDRLHQAMILFAAGRGELMKRFLLDDGIGRDARFWKLAQSLSALYPSGSEEKRWVDGVLARKKGLGL